MSVANNEFDLESLEGTESSGSRPESPLGCPGPSRTLTSLTTTSLVLGALLSALSLLSPLYDFVVSAVAANQPVSTSWSPSEENASVYDLGSLLLVPLIAEQLTFFLIVVWSYRAATFFADRWKYSIDDSPLYLVLSFFIPVVQWYEPFRILKRYSEAASPAAIKRTFYLRLWWASTLLIAFVAIAFGLAPSLGIHFFTIDWFGLVYCVLQIARMLAAAGFFSDLANSIQQIEETEVGESIASPVAAPAVSPIASQPRKSSKEDWASRIAQSRQQKVSE